jgi:hypothetical protein
MTSSINSERAFDKIQHSFMIKILNKSGIKGMYLVVLTATYNKTTANIILNGKKLKAVSLRSETRQGCLLFSILFNKVLGI